MGIKYWENVSNSQMQSTNTKNKFDPRHVQILLRTYKTGAAAAILTHTGDPNVALKQQFDKDHNKDMEEAEGIELKGESHNRERAAYKYDKLKRAVNKIKVANASKKPTRKETVSLKFLSYFL